MGFRSVVVITLASHARGPGFETQRKQLFYPRRPSSERSSTLSSGKTEQFAAKAVYVGKAEKACEGEKRLIPLGFEPRTFRVLGGCDNHYTTESALKGMADS